MAKKPLVLPVILLLASAGGLAVGGRKVTAQHGAIGALESRIEILNTEVVRQREARETLRQNVILAEAQLERLQAPAPVTAAPADPRHEADVAFWLARHERLKQLFIIRPDQAIPALRLLTDADWLGLARTNRVGDETEIRRALARARTLATQRLLTTIRESVRSLAAAADAMPPTTIHALTPHLKDPALADLLADLQIEPLAAKAGESGSWRIQTNVPLDPDYEPICYLTPDGRITVSIPPLR